MEQSREPRNRPHKYSQLIWQMSQCNPIKKQQTFQQMVLKQLDIHRQNKTEHNETKQKTNKKEQILKMNLYIDITS